MLRNFLVLHLDDQRHTVDWIPDEVFVALSENADDVLRRLSPSRWEIVVRGLSVTYIFVESTEMLRDFVSNQQPSLVILDFDVDGRNITDEEIGWSGRKLMWTAYPGEASLAFPSLRVLRKGSRNELVRCIVSYIRELK